jgi:hypothetical protein
MIKLTNRYNASTITCPRHMAITLNNFFSTIKEQLTDEECPKCRLEREKNENPEKVKRALMSEYCAYTRFRFNSLADGGGYVSIYHRDDNSPTGVMQVASINATDFDNIYNNLISNGLIYSGLSPLSPTEGLQTAR